MPKVSDDHLAARRSQILDGARRCFAEYGYDGATVRRLEEAIGLSRGAIFHHFRDKDSLFLAVAEDDAATMVATVAEHGLVQVMRDLLDRAAATAAAARSTRPTWPAGSAASWRCRAGCAPTPSSPSAGPPAPRRSPPRPATG